MTQYDSKTIKKNTFKKERKKLAKIFLFNFSKLAPKRNTVFIVSALKVFLLFEQDEAEKAAESGGRVHPLNVRHLFCSTQLTMEG